jgi:hypothetical protein
MKKRQKKATKATPETVRNQTPAVRVVRHDPERMKAIREAATALRHLAQALNNPGAVNITGCHFVVEAGAEHPGVSISGPPMETTETGTGSGDETP